MPNRKEYRRAGGALSGPYETVRVVDSSLDGSTVFAGWPIKSNAPQEKLFESYFMHRPATGETRVVLAPGGYNPPLGTLTADYPFSSGIVVGEEIEIYGVIDPRVLNEVVNDTLKLCLLTQEIVIYPPDGVSRLNLSSWMPWIKSEEDVRNVAWLDANEIQMEIPDLFRADGGRLVRGEVRQIGDQVYWFGSRLTASNQVLVFQVAKQHYYHCRPDDAGSFGDQAGLDTDAAEASADVDWVAAGMLMKAWDKLGRVSDVSNDQRIKTDRAEAAMLFSSRTDEHYKLPQQAVRPYPKQWGPWAGRRGGWR